MIIAPAIEITPAKITATNISTGSDPAAYNSGTTYALGDLVTDADGRYIYQSLQGSNTGNALPTTDAATAYWQYVEATDKFKPWEYKITRIQLSNTLQNADTIEYTIEPGETFSCIGFFEVDANNITVVVTDPVEGEVYNQTYDLQAPSESAGMWSYLFSPISRVTQKVEIDLPAYANAEIDITIDNTGGTASVGQIVVGRHRVVGAVLQGTTISIRDFSTIEQDISGSYTAYLDRGSSTVVEYQFSALTSEASSLKSFFDAQLRGKGAIYASGENTEEYGTSVFGRGESFSLPLGSVLSFTSMKVEQFK